MLSGFCRRDGTLDAAFPLAGKCVLHLPMEAALTLTQKDRHIPSQPRPALCCVWSLDKTKKASLHGQSTKQNLVLRGAVTLEKHGKPALTDQGELQWTVINYNNPSPGRGGNRDVT